MKPFIKSSIDCVKASRKKSKNSRRNTAKSLVKMFKQESKQLDKVLQSYDVVFDISPAVGSYEYQQNKQYLTARKHNENDCSEVSTKVKSKTAFNSLQNSPSSSQHTYFDVKNIDYEGIKRQLFMNKEELENIKKGSKRSNISSISQNQIAQPTQQNLKAVRDPTRISIHVSSHPPNHHRPDSKYVSKDLMNLASREKD